MFNQGVNFICGTRGYIYFIDLKSQDVYKVNKNNSHKSSLDIKAKALVASDNRIFYMSVEAEGNIYCYDELMEESWKVSIQGVNQFQYYNGFLYCVDMKTSSLSVINLEDNSEKVLIKDEVKKFYISSDFLYYMTEAGVRRRSLSDEKEKTFTKEKLVDFYVYKEELYYIESNNINKWFKLTGLIDETEVEFYPLFLTGDDRFMYMSEGNDSGKIHRVSGDIDLRIFGDESKYIYLDDHSLYFYSGDSWKQLDCISFEIKEIGRED